MAHRLATIDGTSANAFSPESYATFLTSQPEVDVQAIDGQEPYHKFFARQLVPILRRDNLSRILPTLCSDMRAGIDPTALAANYSRTLPAGVLDPFDLLYRLVFQLTMRTVGATEIASDPSKLNRMLYLFEAIDAAANSASILFPWAPNLGKLKRMLAGARAYMMIDEIVKSRRAGKAVYPDSMQALVDGGGSPLQITGFVIGSLYAGLLNSGISAGSIVVELAQDAEWLDRVKREVDHVVARHGADDGGQSAADVLDTLDIEAWETEFPIIDLCLRETIRLQLTGAAFRKNTSGANVPIGDRGEVIPPGAYAVYSIDDVHMNPDVYADPGRWDPGRYLPERAEDKKTPVAYLGWGYGRHPCRESGCFLPFRP